MAHGNKDRGATERGRLPAVMVARAEGSGGCYCRERCTSETLTQTAMLK